MPTSLEFAVNYSDTVTDVGVLVGDSQVGGGWVTDFVRNGFGMEDWPSTGPMQYEGEIKRLRIQCILTKAISAVAC